MTSNVSKAPTSRPAEERRAETLEFYTHPPRYPAVQSVGGAVVGQVIVLPSSPEQGRKEQGKVAGKEGAKPQ